MSHQFPKTLRGQSKATGERKGHPHLLLWVLVLLPGSSLAGAEGAVGCCWQSWSLLVPTAAPQPPQLIRAGLWRRRQQQRSRSGHVLRAKRHSWWDA